MSDPILSLLKCGGTFLVAEAIYVSRVYQN